MCYFRKVCMLMGWVVFSVMGGGNSTKVITPHCDVIRVTKPPLGLFVPVVSDFVEASVVISKSHLSW